MYLHTSATATRGTMKGTKYRLVKKPRTVRFFKPFSTTARNRPRMTTPGTVKPTKEKVTLSDFQNSGSSNSRKRKFSSPTKYCSPGRLNCRLSQNVWKIG